MQYKSFFQARAHGWTMARFIRAQHISAGMKKYYAATAKIEPWKKFFSVISRNDRFYNAMRTMEMKYGLTEAEAKKRVAKNLLRAQKWQKAGKKEKFRWKSP